MTARAIPTNEIPLPPPFVGIGEVRPAVWTTTPLPDSRDLRISIECSGSSAVQVEGGYSLRITGQAASAKPGTPDVPRLAKLFPGVKGARAVLALHGKDPTNMVVAIASAEGFRLDDSESPARGLRSYRQPDADIYRNNQFWPSELGGVEEAWIGTQKVVRVECFPVQYNAVTRTVRFYRRLEGTLKFEREEPIPLP